ncbi:IclR family transcriptional regulator [Pseudactinotalea suaedae]|uniref:IclR family transcriptional regulator n=1 Tax=Pseudactinotalea suaedae TaxID=1524924 RepID=UPI0013914EF8|nr:IclR family transcriptional regulator [Pseudactinotalea suaedae]
MIDVLETLAAAQPNGQTVSELSRDTDISRPSLYRTLTALERRGWAVRQDQSWMVGPSLAGLSEPAPRSANLIERTRPALVRLWEEYGETVNLGIPSRDEVLYLDILESVRGLRTGSQVGSRDPMHATALGKIFLAARPSSEVRRLLGNAELPRLTPRTIVTLAPLMRELAEVSERGWAIDDEESELGVRCVAAPVRDRDGRTVAAISLSAPTVRFDEDSLPEVAAAVRSEAAALVL